MRGLTYYNIVGMPFCLLHFNIVQSMLSLFKLNFNCICDIEGWAIAYVCYITVSYIV